MRILELFDDITVNVICVFTAFIAANIIVYRFNRWYEYPENESRAFYTFRAISVTGIFVGVYLTVGVIVGELYT